MKYKMDYYKVEEQKAILSLYNNYLLNNNVSKIKLVPIEKKLSFDAICISGQSKVLIEHKKRSCSAFSHSSTLLQDIKLSGLKTACNDYDGTAWYVVEHTDYLLIYNVNRFFDTDLNVKSYLMQSTSFENNGLEWKHFYELDYFNEITKPDLILRTNMYDIVDPVQFKKEYEQFGKEGDELIARLLNND